MNFLCDPRVQLLSAQEESFLFRLFEARLRNDLSPYGGHFPTDPKLLRPIAYPHKPGPRDSFLQCLIAKLEQVRIATMIPPAPCAVFDLPPYLPVLSDEVTGSPAQPSSNGVIHIDGPGPPKKPNQIAVVAAAAADSLDLIERLKPFYPRHDLQHEWRDYVTHQRKLKKQSYAVSDNPKVFTFVKWLEKAAIPIGKPAKEVIDPLAGQSELDFTEPATPRFLAEFESRKARRAS